VASQPQRLIAPIGAQLWQATTKLITITDHMKTLEAENERLRLQVGELTGIILDHEGRIGHWSGQMHRLEQRLADKDRTMDAVIALKVVEALAKDRAVRPA
jgi:hypothetical protein